MPLVVGTQPAESLAKVNFGSSAPEYIANVRADDETDLSFKVGRILEQIGPGSTSVPGWSEFLDAYKKFLSARGAAPLFNQTSRLTRGRPKASSAHRKITPGARARGTSSARLYAMPA